MCASKPSPPLSQPNQPPTPWRACVYQNKRCTAAWRPAKPWAPWTVPKPSNNNGTRSNRFNTVQTGSNRFNTVRHGPPKAVACDQGRHRDLLHRGVPDDTHGGVLACMASSNAFGMRARLDGCAMSSGSCAPSPNASLISPSTSRSTSSDSCSTCAHIMARRVKAATSETGQQGQQAEQGNKQNRATPATLMTLMLSRMTLMLSRSRHRVCWCVSSHGPRWSVAAGRERTQHSHPASSWRPALSSVAETCHASDSFGQGCI